MTLLNLKSRILPLLLALMIFTPLTAAISQNMDMGDVYDEDETGEMEYLQLEFDLLRETLDVNVDVATLFMEEELLIGTTVSRISAKKWKQMGARRLHEALGNEMSVVSYPTVMGAYSTIIRGYAQAGAAKGVSILVDGIPTSDIASGSPVFTNPNWSLGTLDRIEIIKGPGSAVYGSDAFHGVISLKTFKSDTDYYSAELSGAYPLYSDTNVKVSQGLLNNLLRVDFSAGAAFQDDQELEYEYSDPRGYQHTLVTIDSAEGTAKRKYKYNSQSSVLKLRIDPAEKLGMEFGVYANRGKYEDFPGVVSVINSFLDSEQELMLQDNDLSSSESLFTMATGSAVYRFPDRITLEATGFSWNSDRKYISSGSPSIYDATLTTEDGIQRTGAEVILKQPDNRLNLQWLIAYSFSRMDINSSHDTIKLKPFSDTSSYITYYEYDNTTQGYSRKINSVYGQAKWGIVKNRLLVLLGCRNDYYSDFGNQVSPRGWLVFLPTAKSSIKTSYGRAYRAPSAIEQEGKIAFAMGGPDLEPEIIDVYELGYMYKGKKSKISINTFYSRWENGIVFEETPDRTDFIMKYLNKGENDAIGGEANLFYSPKPFAMELGFSYVKSRALDIAAPEAPEKTVDRGYNAFPEYSVNAGLYYILEAYNINLYLNNIIYLNMREAPDAVRPLPDSLPPYYRMDLNISSVPSDNLELYLNIRNILNRENRMPSMLGAGDGYVEPGISVMLRVGYKL